MLEKQFAGEKYINKCIAEYLPGKTYKQISDKRCGLKQINRCAYSPREAGQALNKKAHLEFVGLNPETQMGKCIAKEARASELSAWQEIEAESTRLLNAKTSKKPRPGRTK